MLQFFRRFTKSRLGLIAVFIFLGIMALAFAVGDITGLRSQDGGPGGNVIAQVGRHKVTDIEVRERIERFLQNAQRQGQTVTMAEFLAQGGLDVAVDEIINSAAIVAFAEKSGMQVSKRLIDGEIASNPAFLGLDGKFSQKQFEDLLAQNRISPIAFRRDLEQERYGNWLISRATLGNQLPDGVVLPYASLLLERRTGVVGLVQSIAMDPGPDPDDKTLNSYYASNRARYSVPQRRVIRYAAVTADAVRAQAAATDAEIADAYKKAGNRYAATEKRTVRQVIIADQATANRIAAQVKGGQAMAAAAAAAGLEPSSFDGVEKAALATRTSPQIADAAFGAAQGGVVGPVRSPLGWHVLKVEKVERVAARSLDQVRGELAKEVTDRKVAQRLADLRQSIDDGVADGKTFDEAIRDAKLSAQTTPALTAQGQNPENPAYKPDPALVPILRAGFGVEQAGDEPQVVPTGADGSFALVTLDRIVPAAPRPLAQIRDQVKGDYLMTQALQKARAAATQIVAKLQKGVPMAQAFAEAGVKKGPPPKPFDLKRAEVLGRRMEPFIQMAFSMAPKKAKLVEGPNRLGYYVVYLDQVEQHSAAGNKAAIARVRGDIAGQVGPEYARQFIRSIRAHMNVKRNEKAVAQLRAQLAQQGVR
ncbi:peptidylprolyl isomerase [Sphingomonas xinjiangensis]|uniref:Parvulin-like PPIase n=1 Tax=Sphingomonas xinjiangensis TaxID=643568 RepID=A0A840YNZ4_9SPHN|nr:peptidylprolyl isomerase [Sphingomonas xinjiangensis]MBB5708993.1 peptidyl-prolyl cis-trans isomerase D [Sphingomonas xinjiangensis]